MLCTSALFMRAAGGYDANVANANAVAQLPATEYSDNTKFLTLRDGYDQLPITLVKEFSESFPGVVPKGQRVHMNHRLAKIQIGSGEHPYTLIFEPTVTTHGKTKVKDGAAPVVVHAKKIILAMPRGLQDTLQKIVDASGLVFTTTTLGKTVLDERQPQFVGTYAGPASPAITRAVMQASDCPIALGTLITDDYLDITAARFGQMIEVSDEGARVGYQHYRQVRSGISSTGCWNDSVTQTARRRSTRSPARHPRRGKEQIRALAGARNGLRVGSRAGQRQASLRGGRRRRLHDDLPGALEPCAAELQRRRVRALSERPIRAR